MANSRQALKRVRQNEKCRAQNVQKRSRLRTSIKQVRAAIAAKDVENAKSCYSSLVSLADKLVNKGIIQKNKASRLKSRLNQHLKAIA